MVLTPGGLEDAYERASTVFEGIVRSVRPGDPAHWREGELPEVDVTVTTVFKGAVKETEVLRGEAGVVPFHVAGETYLFVTNEKQADDTFGLMSCGWDIPRSSRNPDVRVTWGHASLIVRQLAGQPLPELETWAQFRRRNRKKLPELFWAFSPGNWAMAGGGETLCFGLTVGSDVPTALTCPSSVANAGRVRLDEYPYWPSHSKSGVEHSYDGQ